MSKNKFSQSVFSSKLFFEAFKQIKIIGLISAVISTFISLVFPVSLIWNYYSHRQLERPLTESVNLFEISFGSILMVIVVVPLLTLYAFRFLNQRNSSDFYHSIPISRTCLYFSFFAAVLAWVFIGYAASSVIPIILVLIFNKVFALNFASIVITALSILVSCFLLVASISLVMSITGTIFTNVIVSLMLIFIPRVLILLITIGIQGSVSLLPPLFSVPSFATSYNLPFATLFTLLGFSYNDNIFSTWQPVVYTFFLSLAYTFIGLVLFRKRKSEAAGQSAPNKTIQAIFRLTISFLVSCFATVILFDSNGSENLLVCIIIYLFSIILFYLFEIVSMKSAKTLIKITPSLLILILLNIAAYGILSGGKHSILSYQPNTQEIKSIRIINQNVYTYQKNYFNVQSNNIKIADDNVKEIVSNALKSNIEKQSELMTDGPVNSQRVMGIAIKNLGPEKVRYIYFSVEEVDKISQYISKSQDFKKVFTNLPDIGELNTTANIEELTEKQSHDIYKAFQKDVKNMPFEKWYALANQTGEDIANDIDDTSYSPSFFEISVFSTVNMKHCSYSVHITNEFPLTVDKYFDILNAKKDKNKITNALNGLKSYSKNNFTDLPYLDIRSYNIGDEKSYSSYGVSPEMFKEYDSSDLKNNTIRIFDILLELSEQDKKLDKNKSLYQINFYDDKGEYNVYTIASDSPDLDKEVSALFENNTFMFNH